MYLFFGGIYSDFTPYTATTVVPSHVTALAESSTIISVQWDGLSPCEKVNGLIVEYRVQYTAESNGAIEIIVQSGEWNVTGAQVSLTRLTPFTNYSIQVAAVNEQGDVGPYSDSIREQTKEDGDHISLSSMSVSYL